MKKYTLCGVTLAILGVLVTPTFSQTQSTTTTSTSTGYIQSSKIIGTKVKSAKGEEVGVVKDVILDRNNGCMAYTVLSASGGGRASTGGKLVAVPWTVYSSTEPSNLVVRVDRERIYNAPVFEYAKINEYATSGYINNVDTYYGVSTQVGATSTSYGATGTTNTNVNTATGTNANMNRNAQNPNPNNPPPPAEGPGNSPANAQTSPMASASPATSAPPANPSASPSSKTSQGQTGEESTGKGKSGATTKHHRETNEQGTEEGTKTKSARHHRTGEEGTEPQESPSKEQSKSSHHRTTTEIGRAHV